MGPPRSRAQGLGPSSSLMVGRGRTRGGLGLGHEDHHQLLRMGQRPWAARAWRSPLIARPTTPTSCGTCAVYVGQDAIYNNATVAPGQLPVRPGSMLYPPPHPPCP